MVSDLISVIVPVYNVEEYVEACLHSLVNQTYKNVEILVVDDGATDHSGELCDTFAKTHPGMIRVYHTENHGLSAARNVGLAYSKGDFVCFVDSDDWVEPEMIETLHRNICLNHADISTCGMLWDYGIEGQQPLKSEDCREYDQKSFYHEMICNPNVYGYACNKLIKGDIARKYSFDESLFSQEDMDFCMNLAKECSRIVSTDSQLYHYRQRKDSMTGELKYSDRKLSVAKVYERAMPVYAEYCCEDLHIIEMNYLKILINILGRMNVSKIKDETTQRYIKEGIHKHLMPVLKNGKNSWEEKANIIVTYMFPGIMLQLKQRILKIRRTKKI